VKQYSNSKSVASGCLKVFLVVFGSIALLFGVFGLVDLVSGGQVVGTEEDVSYLTGIIMTTFSFAVGFGCFATFFMMLRQAKIIGYYIALIGNKKSIPIKWLAEKRNVSQEKVIKDLYKMMSRGVFTDGHIEENMNILLFPDENSIGEFKTVICKNCGGSVVIREGHEEKCTYCGARIRE